MKKNKVFLLFIISLFFLMIAGFNKVDTKAILNLDENIKIEGAQVRTVEPVGLRFVGKADGYELKENRSFGIILAYGIVSTPETFIIDGTVNGKEVLKGEVTNLNADKTFTLTLINIPENMFTHIVSARAYVKDGNDVKYGNIIERSIYQVAKVEGDRSFECIQNILYNSEVETQVELNGGTLNNVVKDYDSFYDGFVVNAYNEGYDLNASNKMLGIVKNEPGINGLYSWRTKIGFSFDKELRKYVVDDIIETKLAFDDTNRKSDFYFLGSSNYAEGNAILSKLKINDILKIDVDFDKLPHNSNVNILVQIKYDVIVTAYNTSYWGNSAYKTNLFIYSSDKIEGAKIDGSKRIGFSFDTTKNQYVVDQILKPNETIANKNTSEYYIACSGNFASAYESIGHIKVGDALLFDREFPLTTLDKPMTIKVFNDKNNNINKLYVEKNAKLPEPTKTNYEFDGWYTTPDFQLDTLVTTLNENTKIYAKWNDNLNDQQKLNFAKEELTNYFNNLGTVKKDITLPNTMYGATITYTSNDQNVLTNEGKFNTPTCNTIVELTANINLNGTIETATFKLNTRWFKQIDNVVAGYVYDNNTIEIDRLEKMNIVYIAFADPNEFGEFTKDLDNIVNAKTNIVDKAHEKGTYAIISIAPTSPWRKFCNNEANMSYFADQVVKLINEYDFDGVDIDWEYTSSGAAKLDSKFYPILIKIINEKVKANNPNHLVTSATYSHTTGPEKHNIKECIQYLDYVNLMCYDQTFANGQYHNALYSSEGWAQYNDKEHYCGWTIANSAINDTVLAYLTVTGMTKNQIIVGVPFYGRVQKFNKTNTYGYDGWTQSKSPKTMTYQYIKTLINNGYKTHFDERCGASYLLSDDFMTFVSYESTSSIEAKATYVKDNKLGGMMYWQNSQDTTGELFNALYNGMKVTQ